MVGKLKVVQDTDLLHDSQAKTHRWCIGISPLEAVEQPIRAIPQGRAWIANFKVVIIQGDPDKTAFYVVLNGIFNQIGSATQFDDITFWALSRDQ